MARWSLIFMVFAFAVASAIGCNQTSSTPTETADKHDEAEHGGHTHGAWWCAEHGMPEEVCAQCDPKVAAELKAKGDWCAEHNVPLSQCFVHTPDAQTKFAAQYEAKYGKAPPPLE